MNHKEFFNSMADKWDIICHHDQNKIIEIMDLVNIQQGDRVLDVGTGTGIMIPVISSRVGWAGKVTAVDLAEKMIAVAKSKYNDPNTDFMIGDVFTLDLPAEYYDVIMCYSVFPHFEYKLTAANKLGNYLKPGGKIVICHSQSRDEINHLHKNASQAVSRDYLPDAATIMGYLSQCGFNTTVTVDNDRMFVLIGQKPLFKDFKWL